MRRNKNGACGRLGAELRNKMALGWNQLFQIGQSGANETKLVATSRATDVGRRMRHDTAIGQRIIVVYQSTKAVNAAFFRFDFIHFIHWARRKSLQMTDNGNGH